MNKSIIFLLELIVECFDAKTSRLLHTTTVPLFILSSFFAQDGDIREHKTTRKAKYRIRKGVFYYSLVVKVVVDTPIINNRSALMMPH